MMDNKNRGSKQRKNRVKIIWAFLYFSRQIVGPSVDKYRLFSCVEVHLWSLRKSLDWEWDQWVEEIFRFDIYLLVSISLSYLYIGSIGYKDRNILKASLKVLYFSNKKFLKNWFNLNLNRSTHTLPF